MKKFKNLISNINQINEQLQIDEVLKASDPTSKWISDFVHSDNPKFEGKTKKQRIQMALGAAYAAKRRNEDLEIDLDIVNTIAEQFNVEIDIYNNFELAEMARIEAMLALKEERSTDYFISMVYHHTYLAEHYGELDRPAVVDKHMQLAQEFIEKAGPEYFSIDEDTTDSLGELLKEADLSSYKRRNIKGLYTYHHFEAPNGNFVQIRHGDDPDYIHYNIKTGTKTTFRTLDQLKSHIKSLKEEAEQIDEINSAKANQLSDIPSHIAIQQIPARKAKKSRWTTTKGTPARGTTYDDVVNKEVRTSKIKTPTERNPKRSKDLEREILRRSLFGEDTQIEEEQIDEATKTIDNPKVHDLRHISSHDVRSTDERLYAETQTNDKIKDGDVLRTKHGVGIMNQAWPVHHSGKTPFHQLKPGYSMNTIDNGKYKKSVELANKTHIQVTKDRLLNKRKGVAEEVLNEENFLYSDVHLEKHFGPALWWGTKNKDSKGKSGMGDNPGHWAHIYSPDQKKKLVQEILHNAGYHDHKVVKVHDYNDPDRHDDLDHDFYELNKPLPTTPHSKIKAHAVDIAKTATNKLTSKLRSGQNDDIARTATNKLMSKLRSRQNESVEQIDEAKRLISTHGDGIHTAKVYKDTEWGEYQVHYFKNGKHMGEGPVSHHDDKEDAENTAKHEVKRMNDSLKEGRDIIGEAKEYVSSYYDQSGSHSHSGTHSAKIYKDDSKSTNKYEVHYFGQKGHIGVTEHDTHDNALYNAKRNVRQMDSSVRSYDHTPDRSDFPRSDSERRSWERYHYGESYMPSISASIGGSMGSMGRAHAKAKLLAAKAKGK